jgi:hypothetical protein
VTDLRREARALKEVVAEQALELRLLKKHDRGWKRRGQTVQAQAGVELDPGRCWGADRPHPLTCSHVRSRGGPSMKFPALEENIGAATFALALDDFREIDGAVSEIPGQGLDIRNICGK